MNDCFVAVSVYITIMRAAWDFVTRVQLSLLGFTNKPVTSCFIFSSSTLPNAGSLY